MFLLKLSGIQMLFFFLNYFEFIKKEAILLLPGIRIIRFVEVNKEIRKKRAKMFYKETPV